MKLEGRHLLLAFGITLVVLAIGGGLYVLGTPAEERARGIDEVRESDLRNLAGAVDVYWTRNGRLPVSLDALTAAASFGNINTRDPGTRARYDYSAKDPNTYELCAVFERNSEDVPGFWSHGAGRQCFTRHVPPTRG